MNFIDSGCLYFKLYFLFFTDEMENTIEFTVLTEVVSRGKHHNDIKS